MKNITIKRVIVVEARMCIKELRHSNSKAAFIEEKLSLFSLSFDQLESNNSFHTAAKSRAKLKSSRKAALSSGCSGQLHTDSTFIGLSFGRKVKQ